MDESRTINSFRNFIVSSGGQIVNLFSKFILRTVFIKILGAEYLGLDGLFTNILTFLSLAELGVGPAMTFSLYEPIASNNIKAVQALMRVFKKSYIIIGIIIGGIGVGITPFIHYLIKDMPNIPNIRIIYILYVLNSAISYFFSYKAVFITANQKDYIVNINKYIFNFLCMIFQVSLLVLSHNYILYLTCQISFTLAQNINISRIANKKYPLLKSKEILPLDKATKHVITQNIFALVFHKIGGMVVFSTDNILLSKMFGLVTVGIYSNYSLIITALETLYGHFFTAIIAGIGNLGVTEAKEHQEQVFNQIFFINFWIVMFCSVAISVLINPVINIWAGSEYCFNKEIVISLVANYYLKGMRQSAKAFNNSYGLYRYYKYMPIPEIIINIAFSVVLARLYGPIGIFLGTIISTICTCLWVEPKILFKLRFEKSVKSFFIKYMFYTAFTVVIIVIVSCITSIVNLGGWIEIVVKLMVCLTVPNMAIIILFRKTDEYKKVVDLGRELLKNKKGIIK